MVIVFKIRNERDLLKVKGQLTRLQKTLPKIGSKLLMKLGKTLERDVKTSARAAGIKRDTGELFDTGIQYRQRTNGRTGSLFIRDYGVKLDGMAKHIVSVRPSRGRLLRWAVKANDGNISFNARKVQSGKWKSFPLRVKGHPFIKSGFRRASKKFSAIIKQELKLQLKNGKN